MSAPIPGAEKGKTPLSGRAGIIFGAVSTALIGLAVYLFSSNNIPPPRPFPPANQPSIAFDSLVKDVGKVDEGVEVKCDFTVFNRGGVPLDIEDVKSSCGCTFPVWKRKRIQPGQSVVLPVTVDTAMKQDKVEKTMDVISNDPARRFVTLTIKLDVNNPHKDMGGDAASGKKPKIFTDEKCMVCHVDQGLGLSGKELFEADCAMCHRVGAHGKNSVAAHLEEMDLSFPGAEKMLQETITHGSPHSRSMPGFLSDVGGPLDRKQIDSLVVYLLKKKGKEH